MRRTLLLLLLPLLLVACQPKQPKLVKLEGKAQGTFYSIIYYDTLARDFQPQVDSLLEAFDMSCSLWKESSLLCRLNCGETDSTDATLEALFAHSECLRCYTDGAFDHTLGALIRLWGFAKEQAQEPSPETIDSLLAAPRTEFNFNAIAQGYAVDLLGEFLSGKGIGSYLINLGGEVIAKGQKPDGSPWKVGIERPSKEMDSAPEVELAIRLKDCSVVTSGSYRKYYEKEGRRISHTIDPRTGRPVEHSLLSASVVSQESWYADGMATAFMVMGLQGALQFIKEHPDDPDIQAAFFIYDSCGQYRTYATPSFQELIIK